MTEYVLKNSEKKATPARKSEFFFADIVFEFAEQFIAATLVRNHKKIDKLTEKISLQCEFSGFCFL